jgi:hypothetical protein
MLFEGLSKVPIFSYRFPWVISERLCSLLWSFTTFAGVTAFSPTFIWVFNHKICVELSPPKVQQSFRWASHFFTFHRWIDPIFSLSYISYANFNHLNCSFAYFDLLNVLLNRCFSAPKPLSSPKGTYCMIGFYLFKFKCLSSQMKVISFAQWRICLIPSVFNVFWRSIYLPHLCQW